MDLVFKLIMSVDNPAALCKASIGPLQGARLISVFQCQEMTINKAGNNSMFTFLGDVQ